MTVQVSIDPAQRRRAKLFTLVMSVIKQQITCKHLFYICSASPKPGKGRRATLMIFVITQCRR